MPHTPSSNALGGSCSLQKCLQSLELQLEVSRAKCSQSGRLASAGTGLEEKPPKAGGHTVSCVSPLGSDLGSRLCVATFWLPCNLGNSTSLPLLLYEGDRIDALEDPGTSTPLPSVLFIA